MSMVMEEAERFWALGLNNVAEKDLCGRHIDERAIKNFIRRTGTPGVCDYCGRETTTISLESLMMLIMETVTDFYCDPADFMYYNSREGGYLGNLYDIGDILQEDFKLDITDNSLFEDVFDATDRAREWANELDYRDSPAETLQYSWQYFKDIVQHRSRYYFAMTKGLNSLEYRLMPQQILLEIGRNIDKYKLVKSLPQGTRFYRCRQHVRGDRSVHTAEGMTAPPQQFATQPNRMSPAGISMFYGGFEADTAIAETVDFQSRDRKLYTTAVFETKKEMTIIDLSALPPVPSPFDVRRRKHYYPLIFLNSFVKDLAKPLSNKALNHIDYVPTQIITEYFRYPFSESLGVDKKIDGIIYPSSKNGKKACVLFLDHQESLEVLDFQSGMVKTTRVH